MRIYEKVSCIEKQVTYLPRSFLNNNVVYYKGNGARIRISSETNKFNK